MSWLAPIGFLGLLGLLVLILIYIIKPNYQNKRISSTYIWRMSLKYKKQRIPISRITELLTFLCQLLILAILGTLLAGPVIEAVSGEDDGEAVIVIDASAGMRITDEGTTRFERAVGEARLEAERTLDGGSRVSVILASDKPEYILTRVGADERASALLAIDALAVEAESRCTYAAADIGGAMTLAEAVLESNAAARVYLYTGTDYMYKNGVNVVNVAGGGEWNAAILGCSAELDNDNHYRVTVDAACYGKTDFITVTCVIHGVNGDADKTVTLERGEFFDPSAEEKQIVFTADDMSGGAVYSYDYIEAYVAVRDGLATDNSYFLYGGKRVPVKIQYASSSPNNFFESAMRTIRETGRESWDVQLTVLREGEEAATEGFDLYIFEHKMPDVLPTDGVVLLVDPDKAPLGSGLQIGSSYSVDSSSQLSPGAAHVLTKHTDATRITVAKYNDIILAEDYEELMLYNGRPVMLLRDTPEAKVIVWAFDLNYSNLIGLPDFPILVYNAFNTFITKTLSASIFEVGDTVGLLGRGESLSVSGPSGDVELEGGRGELVLTHPGTYTVNQSTAGGVELPEESFFVKIPASESDTERMLDVLPFTRADSTADIEYESLALWFAAALFALMLAEWVLEIKKNY